MKPPKPDVLAGKYFVKLAPDGDIALCGQIIDKAESGLYLIEHDSLEEYRTQRLVASRDMANWKIYDSLAAQNSFMEWQSRRLSLGKVSR